MLEQKTQRLKQILNESTYTVVLCGSGLLEELGYTMLKKPERAYKIESQYGVSPEYIFSDGYYSTRPDKFFEFYRKEILLDIEPGESSRCLAKLEKAGKIHCIITSNIYELNQRAGCENVINMQGSVYSNRCSHCRQEYSIDYIKQSVRVPRCKKCNSVVHPGVSLFGDMLDGQIIAKTATELEKAEVLLVLGTTLDSEVFHDYIKYFNGSKMVLVHKEPHLKDKYADMVFYDEPSQILSKMI